MARKAALIEFLASSRIDSRDGGVWDDGAIVAFFAAGTSTPKVVWTNRDKTTPSAAGIEQTTLGTEGSCTVYGDGLYDIKIYDATDTGLTTALKTFSGVNVEDLASGQVAGTAGNSTAFGYNTLAAITSGSLNAAFGYEALPAITTGSANSAFGYFPLRVLTTGSGNCAFGYVALSSVTSGNYNVAIGYGAATFLTTGSGNVAVGNAALAGESSGSVGGSVAIGTSALLVSTGNQNTAVGFDAGKTQTTGSNNSFLGYGAAPSSVTVSNEITLGNTSVGALRCQVALTVLSDRRDKSNIEDIPWGLNFVNDLRPVTFSWDRRDGSKRGETEAGFIAQEVDEVQGKYQAEEFLHLIYKANPDSLGITKENLMPVLVKAIQELSQKNEELANRLTAAGL